MNRGTVITGCSNNKEGSYDTTRKIVGMVNITVEIPQKP